jgi:sec-independent protein translocase protein TatA
MGLSVWHLVIIALVALLVFGGSGRISSLMGDMAKGIKSFRKGLSEDEDAGRPEPPKTIDYTGDKSTMRGRTLQDDLSTQAPPAPDSRPRY